MTRKRSPASSNRPRGPAARPPHRTPAQPPSRAPAPPPSRTAEARAPEHWWRDLWCWAALSSVLVLLGHSLGAPLGEPVAEDFDFLHRALLSGNHTLLDGGGSLAFWRPVSHQLYYLTLGRVMLTEPRIVATLHALLMALAVWLVYRGLRASLSAPVAAVAASFPVLAESTRTVLGWPSQFVDLGLWVFTAWALYETSRGRLWRALVALALALGSKELAIVGAALLPWMPGERSLRERIRWAIAMGAVAAVWACVYLWVRHSAHLELPHNLERSSALAPLDLPVRYQWAWWNSVRAIMSLPLVKVPYENWLWLVLSAIVAVAAVSFAMKRAWRERKESWRWAAWGLAWFALASATLVVIYPLWQPNRSGFGSLGLGVAAAVALEMVSPILLALLVGVRLAAFAAAPGPAKTVGTAAPQTGAFMDFDHLVRLQNLMEAARVKLKRAYPTLPRGSVVVEHEAPRMAEYGFGGSQALQCWYRDTTLRWVRFEDFEKDPNLVPITMVEYQPDRVPIVALVDPLAMRLADEASSQIVRHDWIAMRRTLDSLDAIPIDPDAAMMRSMIESRRALMWIGLGKPEDAERAARLATTLWPASPNGRYWLAYALTELGRFAEAEAQLDTALGPSLADSAAVQLREQVRGERARAGAR